jgi:FtsH-binding integral membrane protein
MAMMVSVGVCLKMGMDPDARRKSPTKWQLLGIFTASEAFTVGLVSSLYGAKTLLSAFLATSTATAGITMYTLMQNNPKYDLSQWGSGLSSTLMVFFFYGLLRFFFGDSFLPMNQMLYSGLGAILFSVYLAYHTRLIVSGKHTKYQMNEKDYVYGAMTLYLDIINIFLRLVQIFDHMENKRE